MLIGSHNSMGYLHPYSIVKRILFRRYRTQACDIETQYSTYGVRVFDISIGVDKSNHAVFQYHNTQYKTFSIYEIMKYLNEKGDCYVRLILDDTTHSTTDERKRIEAKFQQQCKIYEEIYTNIKFFGGLRRSDWTRVYTFNGEKHKPMLIFPETTDKPFFNPESKLYLIIRKLSRRWYARLRNAYLKEFARRDGNDICIMFDRVEI